MKALREDTSGFYRNLGSLPNGTQPKFRLGKDESKASRAVATLEGLWDKVVTVWHPSKQAMGLEGHSLAILDASGRTTLQDASLPVFRPTWDDLTLAMGRAIAAHQLTFPVPKDPTESYPNYLERIAKLKTIFDMILIVPEDQEQAEKAVDKFTKQFNRKTARLNSAITQTSQTLYAAIEDYCTYRATELVDVRTKLPSEHGTKVLQNIRRFKEHHEDIPLRQLTLDKINQIKVYWQKQPLRQKDKEPMAPDTVRIHWGEFRRFLNWLHISDKYSWRKPDGIEAIKFTKPKTKTKKIIATLEEVKILYQFARPDSIEKAFILLGMNCGFCHAEFGSLKKDEIVKSFYGDLIKRDRVKTGVYGEWKLWPETKAIIEHFASKSKIAQVFMTPEGTSYIAPTKGGNSKRGSYNFWTDLMLRIKKVHPDFRNLNPKSLRKGSGQWIRTNYSGELQGIFHSRAKVVASDDQAEAYSDKPFWKVYEATDKLRGQLLDVLEQPPIKQVS